MTHYWSQQQERTVTHNLPDFLRNIQKYFKLDRSIARPKPIYIIARYCFGNDECLSVIPMPIIITTVI